MDQDLKQRLVGAVVITSLAAIFVPMLFDDPIDETGKMISELKIPDAPIKSIDIDSVSLPKSIDEVVNLPEIKSLPENIDEVKSLSGTKSSSKIQARNEKSVSQQADSNLIRWFLQVGTFGEKENALSLQNKIRKQGFPASISTKSGENGLLYKVRVGPELDKNRVEAMKSKIDKKNNLKSIVTSDE